MKKTILNFYSTHKYFYLFSVFYAMAVWSYSTLFVMVLNKHYGFSEILLNYTISFFTIAFMFGNSYINLLLEKNINYFKYYLNGILILIFLSILTAISVYYKQEWLFFGLRITEGFMHGYMAVLIGHVSAFMLSKAKYKTTKSSTTTSISYIIKTVMPIIVSSLLLVEGLEISIYFVGTFIYIFLYFFILVNRKNVFWKYQSMLVRSQNGTKVKKEHNGLKHIIKRVSTFFTDSNQLIEKYHFMVIVFLQNSLRPFYDLYLALLLINFYNYSILKSASLIGFMVIGQASQIIPGLLADFMKLYKFRVIELLAFLLPMYLIIMESWIFDNYYIAAIVFYILGISRSGYAVYEFNLNMNMVKNKVKINHIAFFRNLVGEGAHFLSYFVFGIFLSLGFTLEELYYYPLGVIFVMFVVWYMYDFKRKEV